MRNASADFGAYQFDVSDDQNVIWKARSAAAERLCAAATAKLRQSDVQSAARLAVQAWGQQIMNGTVCAGLGQRLTKESRHIEVDMIYISTMRKHIYMYMYVCIYCTVYDLRRFRYVLPGTRPKSSPV